MGPCIEKIIFKPINPQTNKMLFVYGPTCFVKRYLHIAVDY